MTRWHEDDPPGRILPEGWNGESGVIQARDGEYWLVVCIQAICEREDDPLGRQIGQPLWTEWFGADFFDKFKSRGRAWRSLYQQTPTAEEGIHFKREWFTDRYSAFPERVNYYVTADIGLSDEDSADNSEIGVWGVAPSDHAYCRDWAYGKTLVDETVNRIIRFLKKYRPLAFISETGPTRRAIEPLLTKAMRDHKCWTPLVWLPHSENNKVGDSRSFQGMSSQGLIHFPITEWAERTIDQLLKLPSGAEDDAADCCSMLGRYLANIWAAEEERSPKKDLHEALADPMPVADFFKKKRPRAQY